MPENSIIRSIREKIGRLMAECRSLKQQNARLMSQCEKLRAENRELAEKKAELEKRVNILELKQGFSGTADNKAANARINRLMREVDKCIALLNR